MTAPWSVSPPVWRISISSIRTLEKRLTIARQNVETQRESLKIAEARFEGGTTSQRDVDQAKTVLASTEATIPALKIQLRQAKDALCVLLGMPPSLLADQLEGKAAEIPAPPPQVVVGIPADLLRRRPDIRSAEYNAAAQCAQIGVAKAATLTRPSPCWGNFGFLASDVGKFTLGDMFNWRSRSGAIGPVLPVEYLQLRPDHQPGAGAGRPLPGVAHHLPEHRPQRPTGRGG